MKFFILDKFVQSEQRCICPAALQTEYSMFERNVEPFGTTKCW